MRQTGRLRRLEKAYRANRPTEWITIMEDMDHKGVFLKAGSKEAYTQEELADLEQQAEEGLIQLVKIVWTKTPLGGEAGIYQEGAGHD